MLDIKIGLLPLYISLYDEVMPDLRSKLEPFLETIEQELVSRGAHVVRTDPCCVRQEFQAAVDLFELQQVSALVTLHLAYSPSMESADILAGTDLPVIILDTTPTFAFGPGQNPDEILLNHGIHGVQDLCNLLIRRGKAFAIEAGHWQSSNVLDRIWKHIQASSMCQTYRQLRIGLLGKSFVGMGDFQVSDTVIKDKLGFSVIHGDKAQIGTIVSQISEESLSEEMSSWQKNYTVRQIDEHVKKQAACANLALRQWIEHEQLAGFSINFMDVDQRSPLTAMPFLEISQAMARGIGYAGEGDVLTASLMSILLSLTPTVSFVEMFCPDWQNNSIFLSHMGEANISLMNSQPLLSEMAFTYTDVGHTVAAFGAFRAGTAALVNLAPLAGDQFRLIITPGSMQDAGQDDHFSYNIRGWFKPDMPLIPYLEAYSRLGGTHHSVVVYDADIDLLQLFGRQMGWHVAALSPTKPGDPK